MTKIPHIWLDLTEKVNDLSGLVISLLEGTRYGSLSFSHNSQSESGLEVRRDQNYYEMTNMSDQNYYEMTNMSDQVRVSKV